MRSQARKVALWAFRLGRNTYAENSAPPREGLSMSELTASNEGMPGSEEGVGHSDHNPLGQVERARDKMGDKPKRKASH